MKMKTAVAGGNQAVGCADHQAGKRIALVVNPVAGIGGKVGLKGSDGEETLQKALALGAVPEAGKKAAVALSRLKGLDCEVITFPGEMGEDVCCNAGISCKVVGDINKGHTTPEDTERAVLQLAAMDPDLLVFAGGDGTARNVASVLQESDRPVLGIPAGCKIHSGVYALNPRAAGELLERFCKGALSRTRQGEVMDIDEDLFRQNIVQARLYGYLNVLDEKRLVQNLKSGRDPGGKEALMLIADGFRASMEEDVLYIMGTGSTIDVIMKRLELPNTLLGVDLVYNGKVIGSDCTERDILEALDQYPKAKIVVTVIGGQGYIFGRGNQQLSAEVIRRVGVDNILIVAGKEKVMLLPGFELHADTGDEEVNAMLAGYRQVIVGYGEKMIMKVSV